MRVSTFSQQSNSLTAHPAFHKPSSSVKRIQRETKVETGSEINAQQYVEWLNGRSGTLRVALWPMIHRARRARVKPTFMRRTSDRNPTPNFSRSCARTHDMITISASFPCKTRATIETLEKFDRRRRVAATFSIGSQTTRCEGIHVLWNGHDKRLIRHGKWP